MRRIYLLAAKYEEKHYEWSYSGGMKYSDDFRDPIDVVNFIKRPDLEVPGGRPYSYGHIWDRVFLRGDGVITKQIE